MVDVVTMEHLIVAAIVSAAIGYLVWKLFIRRRGACEKCALHQAADGLQRKPGGASPPSNSAR